MQGRMKKHQLTDIQVINILEKEQVGRIGTLNSNFTPYIVPVHFVYCNDKIYIHGLSKGQKIANIQSNPSVCFEVDCMHGLIMHEEPCHVNTVYQSVILFGTARLINDAISKKEVLYHIVNKYTPSLIGKELPLSVIDKTTIIEIAINNMTGKYYK